MNPDPAENSLTRLKKEIRADAELARRHAGDLKVARDRRSKSQPHEPVAQRNSYTIDELCHANYTSFLNQAFQALLRRKPDPAGTHAQLRLLVAGHSKIEILGNLRWSAEGRDIGAHVPWLLPRYVLTKLMRIPLLGYMVEWLVALGGLPRIVRHQRASDVFQSARWHELAEYHLGIAQQIEILSVELDKLADEKPELAAKFKQLFEHVVSLRRDLELMGATTTELRHRVLSMNHWQASLRNNLSSLEFAEAERERKSGAFNANVATRVLESDPFRAARLELWSGRLAAKLPSSAQVLDLCSGEDWLKQLLKRGLDASGVDTNSEIGQRARAQGHAIVVAEQASVLARIADHSLHGLTSLDVGYLLRKLPAAELLEEARRVLCENAWVLFGFRGEPSTIADQLDGRPATAIDSELMAHALVAAGFTEVEQVSSDDGVNCVLARVGS